MRCLLVAGIVLTFTSCSSVSTFRAYSGDERSNIEVAIIEGEQYLRQDWLNRYVDVVRISAVDEFVVTDSDRYRRVEVAPGFHDVTVYFYWDLGSQRGLSQALVQFASGQETFSRTMRFNARAGETYTVHAQPVFGEGRREIINLTHVDFWIEDDSGNEIVSKAEGRFIPGNEFPG